MAHIILIPLRRSTLHDDPPPWVVNDTSASTNGLCKGAAQRWAQAQIPGFFGRHLPVPPVVVLVTEGGGGGEQERGSDHEGDEGEAEEEEGVGCQLTAVEDANALAEGFGGGGAVRAERVGWEEGHACLLGG
jgi:hypothetical protein